MKGKKGFAPVFIGFVLIFIVSLIIAGLLKLFFPYLQGYLLFLGVLFFIGGATSTIEFGLKGFIIGGSASAVFFLLSYLINKIPQFSFLPLK